MRLDLQHSKAKGTYMGNWIQLGAFVKDLITGFSGYVTGRAEYVTGCAQILVQPSMQGDKFVEARWFDETRLDVSGDPLDIDFMQRETGADAAAPIK